jgi:hypothetical protein
VKPGRRRPLVLASVLVVAVACASIAAQAGGPTWGARAGQTFAGLLVEMATILPPMFVLLGLFEVWVPRALIEGHVGPESGSAAILWMIALAVVQVGPLYVAFPVAVSLWRKGCAPRNVFVYLGAFSAAKIPMLFFEVTFLGWQFSLARAAVTLPVFVMLALVMERLVRPGFEPVDPD